MVRNSSRKAILMAFALALGTVGCASSGASSRPPGATSTRIVRAELEPLGQIDALQAVQRLRSQWVRSRAGLSGALPVLYVDGTRRGDANELSFLRTDEIERIEYMSPNDATTRFGTGHTGGAIMVTTIRSP